MWMTKDLVKQEQLQGLKTQHEAKQDTKNAFAAAILEQEQNRQDVQESRFRFWGFAHKDSPAMVQLKQCVSQVTDFMHTNMATSEEQFKAQLAELQTRYSSLVEACKDYIASHPNPKTASGKARLALVRNNLRTARREQHRLEEHARDLYHYAQKAGQQDLVWGNILGPLRGSQLDLDKADKVEQGGAGTSELLIITAGEQKVFFKEDEKLLAPSEEIRRHYIQNCEDEQDLEIYHKLLDLMTDSIFDRSSVIFNTTEIRTHILSDDPQEQERGYRKLKMSLDAEPISYDLDFSNIRVRQILRELIPRYTKWLTRYFICGLGKIESGRPLSTRNIATSRMAELLNVKSLVAESRQVYIVDRETTSVRTGIAMAQAIGNDYSQISYQAKKNEETMLHSPEAVRQLVCLQMLDVLCAQIDRNKSNIFATQTRQDGEVLVTGIQAIDNDIAFGAVSYEELNRVASGLNMLPIFEKKGQCTLPALDGNMVASILALSDEVVRYQMQDLLNEAEINALLDRLHGMQNTIRVSIYRNPDLIVDSDKWDAEVANRFKTAQVNRAYADFHNGGL